MFKLLLQKVIFVKNRFYSNILILMTNLQLELLDSLLHSDYILLKCSLISFELSELLLQSLPLSMLIVVMSPDLFFDSVQLISQGLASVLAFHSQHTLQCFLLTAQDLAFLLVCVQLLLKLSYGLIKIAELAFQVGCIVPSAYTTRHH